MRPIKFRGKRVDNKEWEYGYYVEDEQGASILTRHPADGSLDRVRVAPSTVGQFTGLCDKAGWEIYEDDVVRSGNDLILIKWVKAGFMPFRNKDGRFTKQTNWRHTTNGEVIGDVWNNPELVEVPPDA